MPQARASTKTRPLDFLSLLRAVRGAPVLGTLQDGTDYVPQTGTYLLHEGETVIPAGTQQQAMSDILGSFTPSQSPVPSPAGDITNPRLQQAIKNVPVQPTLSTSGRFLQALQTGGKNFQQAMAKQREDQRQAALLGGHSTGATRGGPLAGLMTATPVPYVGGAPGQMGTVPYVDGARMPYAGPTMGLPNLGRFQGGGPATQTGLATLEQGENIVPPDFLNILRPLFPQPPVRPTVPPGGGMTGAPQPGTQGALLPNIAASAPPPAQPFRQFISGVPYAPGAPTSPGALGPGRYPAPPDMRVYDTYFGDPRARTAATVRNAMAGMGTAVRGIMQQQWDRGMQETKAMALEQMDPTYQQGRQDLLKNLQQMAQTEQNPNGPMHKQFAKAQADFAKRDKEWTKRYTEAMTKPNSAAWFGMQQAYQERDAAATQMEQSAMGEAMVRTEQAKAAEMIDSVPVTMPNGEQIRVRNKDLSRVVPAMYAGQSRVLSAKTQGEYRLQAEKLRTSIMAGEAARFIPDENPDGRQFYHVMNKFGREIDQMDVNAIPSLLMRTMDTISYQTDQDGVIQALPKPETRGPVIPGRGAPNPLQQAVPPAPAAGGVSQVPQLQAPPQMGAPAAPTAAPQTAPAPAAPAAPGTIGGPAIFGAQAAARRQAATTAIGTQAAAHRAGVAPPPAQAQGRILRATPVLDAMGRPMHKPLSNQGKQGLGQVSFTEMMADALGPDLEAAAKATEEKGSTIWGSAKERSDWAQYMLGVDPANFDPNSVLALLPHADPRIRKVLPMLAQMQIVAAQPYLHGIRNMRFIAQVQQHVPNPAIDSAQMLVSKLRNMDRTMMEMQSAIWLGEGITPSLDKIGAARYRMIAQQELAPQLGKMKTDDERKKAVYARAMAMAKQDRYDVTSMGQ